MIKSFLQVLALALTFVIFGQTIAFGQSTNLRSEFQNPPNAARPRVRWDWMNGNVTKEGIQKDLEWMKRVGVGGFQNFEVSVLTPRVVEKPLTYMTPEWKDAFRFATELADKLGLEMAIASSPGWSESGGPWVPAKDGMKKYVWTETRVRGGQAFTGKLPQPSDVAGNFQNVAWHDSLGNFGGYKQPSFYADAAVVAYRLPSGDIPFRDLNPNITSSGGEFNINDLTDGNLAKQSMLPPTAVGENAWIRFEFEKPQTFKALTFSGGELAPQFSETASNRVLEASDDGISFRRVAEIPITIMPQNTIAFEPVTARFFRISVNTLQPSPNLAKALLGLPQGDLKPKPTGIAEIVLHTTARINRLEEKAGFVPSLELARLTTPDSKDAIPTADVVDLTSKMKPDGSLDWTPPGGDWIVLRMGYSLTGKLNHAASPEATGLEVDKLDAQAVKDYFENYLDQYKNATGGLMGNKGLQYVITDSYEAEHSTWTKNMMAEFQKRRGYDMKPWLPVLTGRIVKSTEASEKFLWDFRKTLGDLMTENHYDQLTEILSKRGMGSYTQSHEGGPTFIGDGMEAKRRADIPMSAMWVPNALNAGRQRPYDLDIRESASVAHIYGRNLVAAESLTSITNAFSFTPEKLKPTADLELASGINLYVIHTSVHQPLDDKKPGFSMGPFGQYFTRQETWAEQARPWMDYLARSSYLLQQGKFVADIIYYYGEDTNITALFQKKSPDIPEGYNYDFVNADALINVLSVKNGKLVTPSGMSYEVLVLDENAKKMSLPVLRKIQDLVKAGAVVTGIKPEQTPSLSDNRAEFDSIVKEVWDTNKPNVTVNQPLAEVLQTKNINPDFKYSKPNSDSEVLYTHRRLPDQEIYWVNNRKDRVEEIEASFRVTGRVPEIWHADTGKIEKAAYRIEKGQTVVQLHFDPNEAYFVIFRDKAVEQSLTLPKQTETIISTIESPWNVAFQEGRGAPATAVFSALKSLSENSEPGIKYFSGTAAYKTTFKLDSITKPAKILLDLGDVKDLAEVIVNGKNLGVVWKKPFQVDISEAAKTGENTLEVKVTNTWVNRLIGDAQAGVTNKITFTTLPFYQANSPLLPAGLLGPVKLLAIEHGLAKVPVPHRAFRVSTNEK